MIFSRAVIIKRRREAMKKGVPEQTPQPRVLSKEEQEMRAPYRRLAALREMGVTLWNNGDKLSTPQSLGLGDLKKMSNEQVLTAMQEYRRAAIEDPGSVLPSSASAGIFSRSQLPEEHQRKIKAVSGRIAAAQAEEKPCKWAQSFNRELVTGGFITDRPLMLGLRAFDQEMRERSERALTSSRGAQR